MLAREGGRWGAEGWGDTGTRGPMAEVGASAGTDPERLLGDAVLHALQHVHVGMCRELRRTGEGTAARPRR